MWKSAKGWVQGYLEVRRKIRSHGIFEPCWGVWTLFRGISQLVFCLFTIYMPNTMIPAFNRQLPYWGVISKLWDGGPLRRKMLGSEMSDEFIWIETEIRKINLEVITVVQVQMMRAWTHHECIDVEMTRLRSFLPSFNTHSGPGTMSVTGDTNIKPQDVLHMANNLWGS